MSRVSQTSEIAPSVVTMERWAGRVALVTGASSGIGAAIALALLNRDMKVVGCARNVDNVQVFHWSGGVGSGNI